MFIIQSGEVLVIVSVLVQVEEGEVWSRLVCLYISLATSQLSFTCSVVSLTQQQLYFTWTVVPSISKNRFAAVYCELFYLPIISGTQVLRGGTGKRLHRRERREIEGTQRGSSGDGVTISATALQGFVWFSLVSSEYAFHKRQILFLFY